MLSDFNTIDIILGIYLSKQTQNLLKRLSADIILCDFLLIIHKNKKILKNFKKRLAFFESLC